MKHKTLGQKVGLCCMVLGAILVAAALILFLWNQREASQADQSSQQALEQVKEVITETEIQSSDDSDGALQPIDANDFQPVDPTMSEVEINGRLYIGYLSIPALDLELPVQSQWDYPSLKVSPCRYYGSTKTDDLVIAAHNYARHFGGLTQLSPGDLVYFTDMDGLVNRYEVVEVDILNPTDIEEMTAGEYDLTLFTCTYGGKSRVTVRCLRVEDSATTVNE
jgi:sortase A